MRDNTKEKQKKYLVQSEEPVSKSTNINIEEIMGQIKSLCERAGIIIVENNDYDYKDMPGMVNEDHSLDQSRVIITIEDQEDIDTLCSKLEEIIGKINAKAYKIKNDYNAEHNKKRQELGINQAGNINFYRNNDRARSKLLAKSRAAIAKESAKEIRRKEEELSSQRSSTEIFGDNFFNGSLVATTMLFTGVGAALGAATGFGIGAPIGAAIGAAISPLSIKLLYRSIKKMIDEIRIALDLAASIKEKVNKDKEELSKLMLDLDRALKGQIEPDYLSLIVLKFKIQLDLYGNSLTVYDRAEFSKILTEFRTKLDQEECINNIMSVYKKEMEKQTTQLDLILDDAKKTLEYIKSLSFREAYKKYLDFSKGNTCEDFSPDSFISHISLEVPSDGIVLLPQDNGKYTVIGEGEFKTLQSDRNYQYDESSQLMKHIVTKRFVRPLFISKHCPLLNELIIYLVGILNDTEKEKLQQEESLEKEILKFCQEKNINPENLAKNMVYSMVTEGSNHSQQENENINIFQMIQYFQSILSKKQKVIFDAPSGVTDSETTQDIATSSNGVVAKFGRRPT